ncbi:MAG: metal-sensitive transcriptional regulator [Spirochaetota bacterium]
MMDQELKQNLHTRLLRIEGQVRGIRDMLADDRYCVDVLTQSRAVAAALRRVEDLVMRNHLNTCVSEAIRSDDPGAKREKLDEVMAVISRFGNHG